MSDFVIIPDGSGDLTREQREKFKIERNLPGTVLWPDKVSRQAEIDWDSITPNEYFAMMTSKKNVFKTSLPAPKEIYDLLEKYAKEGKNMIIPTISGAMSGTFSVITKTAEELMEDYPGVKIHVIDSRRYGGACGLLAVTAALCRDKGMSFKETCDYLDKATLNIHEAGFLDDLYFLHRSGRVSKMAAVMGTMIGIKPMGDFNHKGTTAILGKAKGLNNAFKADIEYIKKTIVNSEEQIIFVAHSDRPKEAEKYAQMIRDNIPCKEVIVTLIGQGCGVNAGPGLISAYYQGTPISIDNVEEIKIMNDINLISEEEVNVEELLKNVAGNTKTAFPEVTGDKFAYYFYLLDVGMRSFGQEFIRKMAQPQYINILTDAIHCLVETFAESDVNKEN